jgi:biopolymer transport protein ExbB/TolQ
MKIFVFVILFLIAEMQFAQPRFTVEDQLNRLKQELNLNKDQSAKIQVILQSKIEEMKKLRGERSSNGERPNQEVMDSVREKMKEINQKYNDQITKILDKSQKEKFTELQKKMQEERQKRFGTPPQTN